MNNMIPPNGQQMYTPMGCPQPTPNPNVVKAEAVAAAHYLAEENGKLTAIGQQLSTLITEQDEKMKRLLHVNEILQRTKKRKKVGAKLAICTESEVSFVTVFDTGQEESTNLCAFPVEDIFLDRVKFCDFDINGQYFAINIVTRKRENCITFLVKEDKLHNKNFLFDIFIEHGVQFNPVIKQNDIKQVLKEYLISQIDSAEEWQVKALPGWDSDWRFWHQQNTTAFLQNLSKENAPVTSSFFDEIGLSKERISAYFSEMKQIQNPRDRTIIMIYPFLGLLHTLLQKHYRQTFYLNLIPIERISEEHVASWFQIYNRDRLTIADTDQTTAQFEKMIGTLCDDVLMVNDVGRVGESAYQKNKRSQNIAHVVDIVTNAKKLKNGRTFGASLVTISEYFHYGNAINIVLPPENQLDTETYWQFRDKKCLESILSGMISFVINKKELVQQLIRKNRESEDSCTAILETVLDILKAFFKDEGYDLNKEAVLPEEISFSDMFEYQDLSDDDIIFNLVSIVRKEIKNIPAKPKCVNYAYSSGCIYYDAECLYFPSGMIAKMFEQNHCPQKFLVRALTILRSESNLRTDSPSTMIKKVQISGVRKNFHVICRDVFNFKGYVEILDLVKERLQ